MGGAAAQTAGFGGSTMTSSLGPHSMMNGGMPPGAFEGGQANQYRMTAGLGGERMMDGIRVRTESGDVERRSPLLLEPERAVELPRPGRSARTQR